MEIPIMLHKMFFFRFKYYVIGIRSQFWMRGNAINMVSFIARNFTSL